MQFIGKMMVMLGIVIAVIGCLILVAGKTSWFGRLPGDILIQKKNFTIYFPLATSILLSIVLTLIFWLLGRR